MTEDERIKICKAIAKSCMWGHGGIASVIVDELDKKFPSKPPWWRLYDAHKKGAERRSVGLITKETDLAFWMGRGYRLCNYDKDGCSLHHPSERGGGLYKYVSKALAKAHKSPWDW